MLLVHRSSNGFKDVPRMPRSTSVSTGIVVQSWYVILQVYAIPFPCREPDLDLGAFHRLSRVVDVPRSLTICFLVAVFASWSSYSWSFLGWLPPGLRFCFELCPISFPLFWADGLGCCDADAGNRGVDARDKCAIHMGMAGNPHVGQLPKDKCRMAHLSLLLRLGLLLQLSVSASLFCADAWRVGAKYSV